MCESVAGFLSVRNSLTGSKKTTFFHTFCVRSMVQETLLNYTWPGQIELYPPRENLISDNPAGNGKIDSLFYSVKKKT